MKKENDIQADIDAIGRIPIISTVLEVICRTTGMGFAAVARVTDTKWVACSVLDNISFGLKAGGELELKTTICNEIRQLQKGVVIDHVAEDCLYKDHQTPARYGFQSYISMPIFKKDGSFFGTLCAIDPKPAKLNSPEIIGMFTMFADLISFHLNALEEMDISQTQREEDRKTAELREQFIAILGHDLRNPVSAISNSAELLLMMSKEQDILKVANIIKNSTYRMRVLINNMLDFASGRMGGGIPLTKEQNMPVAKLLNQVIAEMHAIWPDQRINTHIKVKRPVHADGNRIAQLFSNLMRNAITYSKPGSAVDVEALTDNKNFQLSVTNQGNPIRGEIKERLFQPFSRGQVDKGQQGLGLGLYITAEIAKAHGGTITVVSESEQTKFTLTIPLA